MPPAGEHRLVSLVLSAFARTIARPCSSAAAITSASRTDPPGCTTAVAPAAATASRPSRNGKNASEAATDPCSDPRRLHHRHLHRVHAAHLARADRQRRSALGEDHGVRLHVRAHAPGEPQRLPLVGGRPPPGHHAEAVRRRRRRRPATAAAASATLSRSCTSSAPRIDRSSSPGRRLARTATRHRRRPRACWPSSPGSAARPRRRPARSTASMNVDAIARAAASSIGRLRPTMPPNADSASASRAAHVGVGDDGAGRGAARIRVLDDDGGGLVELQHDARGSVEIQQIRERQLLALAAPSRRPGRRGGRRAYHAAALVRVLAVAQVPQLVPASRRAARAGAPPARTSRTPRESSHDNVSERRGDRRVVGRRVRKRLPRAARSGSAGGGPPAGRSAASDRRVVVRVDHHQHVLEVLGGRAHQARPADVDLLDQLVERRCPDWRRPPRTDRDSRPRHRWADAGRASAARSSGRAAARQDAAVDRRVQRLDPAVQHLREPGDCRHGGHRAARRLARARAVPPVDTSSKPRSRKARRRTPTRPVLSETLSERSWHRDR